MNRLGGKYYIESQSPEKIAAERKEMLDQITALKKRDQNIQTKIVHGKLLVNNEVQRKRVSAPPLEEVFEMRSRMERKDNIPFQELTPIVEKGNHSTVCKAEVHSLDEIRSAYTKVKYLYPDSDHVVMAYPIANYEGCEDDGEHFAGAKMLRILQ